MPQPFDYISQMQQPDFLQRFTQGLEAGTLLTQTRLAREKEEQAATLKQQYSTDIQSAFTNPTPEAFAQLTAKYPAQREAFKQSFDLLSDERKSNEIAVTGQVYSALQAGNNEVALNIVDEQIVALENAKQDSSKLQLLRDNMERDPKNAMGYAGLVLSSVMGVDKFAETFTKLGAERRAEALAPIQIKKDTQELKNKAAELKLKTAQTNKVLVETKNLGIETKKAALELEALKATDGKDPAKVFDMEKKIRDEYVKRTANFIASQDAFTKIEVSAQDKSGPGDVALITSFMKMLDPGSVVRETEFATAQDTGGLVEKLKTLLPRAERGILLTDLQRKNFVNLSEKYMGAARTQEKRVRTSLNKVVKNYSLNPENVFGVIEEEAEIPPTTERKAIRVKF